jgi:hypothetical protein
MQLEVQDEKIELQGQLVIQIPKEQTDVRLSIRTAHVSRFATLSLKPALWTAKLNVDEREASVVYIPNGLAPSQVHKEFLLSDFAGSRSIELKALAMIARSGLLITTCEVRVYSTAKTLYEEYFYPTPEWMASMFSLPQMQAAPFMKVFRLEWV